jgi:hypothetical protein
MRYVLLEARPEQRAVSIRRQHHLHPSEVRHNRVLVWFQRDTIFRAASPG